MKTNSSERDTVRVPHVTMREQIAEDKRTRSGVLRLQDAARMGALVAAYLLGTGCAAPSESSAPESCDVGFASYSPASVPDGGAVQWTVLFSGEGSACACKVELLAHEATGQELVTDLQGVCR